jgi:hemerythrin-like domain-containing protein
MTRLADAIKDDHRELEEAYNKILSAKTSDEKARWQNQFTWELARHSIGEELIVYPLMEKNLPKGKEMADKDRSEHQTVRLFTSPFSLPPFPPFFNTKCCTDKEQVKEHLYKFQGLSPEDTEFEPTLKSLWTNLSQHIKEEESEDLPSLEKTLDQDDSEKQTKKFMRTKKFIPTRSHPSAPDKPPFETVAGLMAAPIDHLADLFRKFPEESKSQLPP